MTGFDIDNIKSSVTMAQLASMYGYEVNRSGFMLCPFHADTSPSMKVYDGDRGFCCFVCDEAGDIFDFVKKHDGLDFPKAAQRIADLFGIPVSDGRKTSMTKEDIARIKQRKAEREAKEKAKNENEKRLYELSDKIRFFKEIQSRCEPLSYVWCGAEENIIELEREWEYRFEKMNRKG